MGMFKDEAEFAAFMSARGKTASAPPMITSVLPAFTRESKYNAKITIEDGIKFRSKKEANYYVELKARRDVLKEVLFFLPQVPIRLPGGTKYIVDFIEFMADGSYRFIDVKGKKTPAYIKNKKQVEALYPITILEP